MAGPLANARHEQFAQWRAKGYSGLDAYRKAGYSGKENSAFRHAFRLSRNVMVKARIAELQESLADTVGLSAARTMDEIRKLAYANMRDLLDAQGNVKPVSEWPEDAAATISAIDYDNAGQIGKLRTWSKTDALEKAAKILGLFEADNRQKQPEIEIDESELARRLAFALSRGEGQTIDGEAVEVTDEKDR